MYELYLVKKWLKGLHLGHESTCTSLLFNDKTFFFLPPKFLHVRHGTSCTHPRVFGPQFGNHYGYFNRSQTD